VEKRTASTTGSGLTTAEGVGAAAAVAVAVAGGNAVVEVTFGAAVAGDRVPEVVHVAQARVEPVAVGIERQLARRAVCLLGGVDEALRVDAARAHEARVLASERAGRQRLEGGAIAQSAQQ